MKSIFINLLYRICIRTYDKLPWFERRLFIKHITGPMRSNRNQLKSLIKTKDSIRVKYKQQEVERLHRLFFYSRHAKIRISERYGHLTTKEILEDIRNNLKDIIVSRDRSYQMITKDRTYIFSKDNLMITTFYKTKSYKHAS